MSPKHAYGVSRLELRMNQTKILRQFVFQQTCQLDVSFLIIKHRFLKPIMYSSNYTVIPHIKDMKICQYAKNFSSKFACEDYLCVMYPFLRYFSELILFKCARLGYPLTCFMFSQFHIINCPKNTSLLLFSTNNLNL